MSELEIPVVLLGDQDRNFEDAKHIEKLVIATLGSSKGLHVAISSNPDEHGNRAIDWPIRRSLGFCQVSDLVIGPDTGLMWGVAFEQMPKIMLHGHASPENTTKYWINTITLHGRSAARSLLAMPSITRGDRRSVSALLHHKRG